LIDKKSKSLTQQGFWIYSANPNYIIITVENKANIFNLAILSFRHSKSFSDFKNILKGDFWATLDVLSRQKPEDS
jgi:hypothetical protein